MSTEEPAPSSPIPASEIQRRAISGSTWTALTSMVGITVAFIGNAIVARALGVIDYGHLAFLTTTFGLLAGITNFGFSTALIQEASSDEARGQRSRVDDLLRRSFGFHTAVELPLLIAIALALTRNDSFWVTLALLIAVIFSCVFSGSALTLTIENRTASGARLAALVGFAVQGVSIAVALSTHSATAVWAVRTVVPALALVFNLLLFGPHRRRTVFEWRLPRGLGWTFWRFSLLSCASGLVAYLVFSRSEIFILQFFGKTEALGLFALAFGLAGVLTAPADAMLHPLLPAVAGILSAWPERAAAAFDRSTRVSALVCGGLTAVVVPGLFFLVPAVYGSGFRSAAWLFLPLAVLSTFQSANNPVMAFVNGRRRGGLLLKSGLVSLAVDVAVAVALIPPFGAWGAVVANVAGQLVCLVWLTATEPIVIEHRLLGMLGLYRSYMVGVVAGVGAVVAGLLVRSQSDVLAALAAGAVGGVVFLAGVRATRTGLSVDDRDALAGAFAPPMRPYLNRILSPITGPGG